MPPCDLREACDRGGVGLHQFRLACPACPIAVVPNIAGFHPLPAFMRVSAFRPSPEHLPLGLSNLLQDVFGCTVPIILRPSPYDRVECFDDLPCRGLLMCVQVGSRRSHVLEDFFLVWDGQQCSLCPEFPDVKPQEVTPFVDMHYPGFGFIECQASCLEERFYAWSGLGFHYCPGRGRWHKVIGLAHDRDAFIHASAFGWSSWSSIGIFCVEPPFQPIQCHICQQWGHPSSLWRASVRRRAEAHVDDSCFEPLASCGGAYGPFGQQWCMVNVIKAAAHIRVEHPWTTMLPIHRRLDGLNRSHRAAPWPKARGVGFNARLPCWLQGRLDDCLHHPVLSGRDAQGSLVPVVFREIHPSDRAGLVPLEAQAFLKQPPAGFRSGVHPPIHPCRVFALVFLGDTSDRQERVGRGSNQSLLEVFHPPPCRVRGGAIDTLLPSSSMPFHRVPLDVSPRGVGVFCSPFSAYHRLTSPKIRTLLDSLP